MSVYWVGDFETGNRSQYSTMFGSSAAVGRTSFPQANPTPLQGKYCCRIELRPGELHSDGTSRLQLRGTAGSGVPSAYFARGSHLWFRYAVMIGAETAIYQNFSNPWRAVTAWPSVDDGAFSPSKMFCQRINGIDQIYFGGDSGVSGASDHLQGTAVSNPKAMDWYEFVSEWLFHETNGIIAHYVRKPGETSFTPIPLDAKAKLTNRTLTSSTDRSNLRYGTYRNKAFTSNDVFYLDRMTAYTTEAEAFADTPINVGGGTTTPTTPGLPPAPTGIKAVAGFTAAGAHKVDVSCDPVPDLIAGDGYYVSRNEARISGNTPLPSPAYTDADPALTVAVEYRYRMYAGLAPNRLGPWTEPPATVTLAAQTDVTPPATPGVVVATSVTATSVAMSWAASPSADVVSYRLERNVNGGAWAVLAAALDVTTYTDTGLTGGTTYGYRVSAIDAAGNVSQASQETLVTPAAVPGTPTGVTVSAPSARRLTVSWSAVAGASAYNVWRNNVLVAAGVAGTTLGEDVEPGDYVYQVTAGTAPNVSAKSAGVAGTAYGIIGLPEFIELPSRQAGTTTPITSPISLTGRGQFTATDSAAWLAVAPASATLSDTPVAVTVTADPTGLPSGALTGVISFAEAPSTAAPVNTAAPTITGTLQAGQTLTGGDGTWSGSPTGFARKWYRNSGTGGAWVQVATTQTYALTAGDVGFSLRFGVVATNAGGSSAEAFSADSAAVGAAPTAPTNAGAPAISGTAQSGSALTGTMGTWNANGSAITGYAYQWQREAAAGSGTYTNITAASGTSSGGSVTYTSVAGDVGLRIRLSVTATNAAGTSTAAVSSPTAAVTSAAASLVLARYALALAGGTDRIILANAGSVGVEPLTIGGLVYFTPGAARRYQALALPADVSTPARALVVDTSTDRAGWDDQANGPRGQTGFPTGTWVWLCASRDVGGTIRAIYCNMATGVWSALYTSPTAGSITAAASAGNIVIGNAAQSTSGTIAWIGRFLVGFKANAYYTQAQMQAPVVSSGGTFYVDPAALLAAPSREHVWRADNPSQPIQDSVGTAHELATGGRVGTSVYDAGSAILPLKVS